jgi:hypothetical protein
MQRLWANKPLSDHFCRTQQDARRIRSGNVALPAKSDSGVSQRRIPADGEGKILKFRASFSEDQKETIDLGGRV